MSTNTEVYLINVPLDKELNHTYWFSSLSEQETFFKSKKIKYYSGLTYQRKDNIIRVPELADDIISANYVMYRNTGYSSKWYYAFIRKIHYKQDDLSFVEIETDPIQTYLFDFNVGESFVEREHVDNDEVGLHTIPENLETGEYVVNDYKYDLDMLVYAYVVHYTEFSTTDNLVGPTNIAGLPTAGCLRTYLTFDELKQAIIEWNKAGKGDAIVSVYVIPDKFLNVYKNEETGSRLPDISNSDSPISYDYLIDIPSKLGNYTPRNKKLLTYPYQYLAISNNSGASNILQFEHFTNDTGEKSGVAIFEVQGVPTIGGSIKTIPKYYKNMVRNYDEGIVAGKFAVLSWSNDYYTNWLTQNSVNIAVSTISSIASIIGGVALLGTGVGGVAGLGMIAGGVMGVSGQMGQIYEHSMIPASAKGNVNAGDINTASKSNTFFYSSMSIKEEYARIIDKYFDMYGYKVNNLKIPNKNHRSDYWYTKCIDANITGNLPQDELQRIINAYNKGITFWRTTANFRRYELNEIV